MSLSNTAAPVAPQGAGAGALMPELMGPPAAGMAPEAGMDPNAAAAPAAGLSMGKIAVPAAGVTSLGIGFMMHRAGRKAAQQATAHASQQAMAHAVEQALAKSGKNVAIDGASHLLATHPSGGGKFMKFGGIAAMGVGALLTGVGLLGWSKSKSAPAPDAAAQQAAYEQQLAMQRAQGGGAGAVDANGNPVPPASESIQQDAMYRQQLNAAMQSLNPNGGGPAPVVAPQQAPAAGAPAGTGTPAAAGTPTPAGATGTPQAPAPGTPSVGGANPAANLTQGAPTGLVNTTINLAAGIGSDGRTIATAGTFTIQSDLGTFPSAAAAEASIHQAMSSLGLGMNETRFAVIQTPNGFHAVQAAASNPGTPLSPQQGTVVGWDAMTYTDGANGGGLQAYSWNNQRGAVSQQVQMGAVPFAQLDQQAQAAGGGLMVPGQQLPVQQQAIPSQPAVPGVQVPGTVQGGGPTAAPTAGVNGGAFNPSSVLGQTFISNASVGANGAVVAGGPIQIQAFANASAGGFRTADEANRVAQQLAPSLQPGNPYARVITLQAADGNFYLYAGSVVARATAPVQQATPVSVLPAGRL